MKTDWTIANEALWAALAAIVKIHNVSETSIDGDHKSAEIMFKAGNTDYVLKLEEAP